MQTENAHIKILMIGAGGIVNHAHLPAYAIAGFNVAGIFDLDEKKATATAAAFNIPVVYEDLEKLIETADDHTVFDIAVPAPEIIAIIQQLPAHSNLLMQKPMGMNLEDAKKILQICTQKKMNAAVNFQLRYAPFVTAACNMIDQGLIGELCDVEVNVNVSTPWNRWDFLYESPRVEILYHSIHYIDLIRKLLGEPTGIYAKTVKHPSMNELASVRSNIIMDYGDMIRANINTNHCHTFGTDNQYAFIKLEGTKGAVKITLGALKNYPYGMEDSFEYIIVEEGLESGWVKVPVEGTWFPHAFAGSMQQVMDVINGIKPVADNAVQDCIHTMACVEAAYLSSSRGSILLKDIM